MYMLQFFCLSNLSYSFSYILTSIISYFACFSHSCRPIFHWCQCLFSLVIIPMCLHFCGDFIFPSASFLSSRISCLISFCGIPIVFSELSIIPWASFLIHYVLFVHHHLFAHHFQHLVGTCLLWAFPSITHMLCPFPLLSCTSFAYSLFWVPFYSYL